VGITFFIVLSELSSDEPTLLVGCDSFRQWRDR
jgi:hypothetical protein